MLDQVQHLRELDGLDAARFHQSLAADLGAGDQTLQTLGAQLDALRQALDAIEQFARKAMGIRLTHVLSTAPVTAQFRTLLSSTVTTYAGDTALLRRRLGGSLPESTLDEVIDAAERVLAMRQALRKGVLEMTRSVAGAQAPWVQKAARDRSLPDPERVRLRKTRTELDLLLATPGRLATGGFEERLKECAMAEEEPMPEAPQDSRFSLLEID